MVNLFRMEASRLRRKKSTYLILILVALIMVVYGFLLNYTYDQLKTQLDEAEENLEEVEEVEPGRAQVEITPSEAFQETSGKEVFMEQVSGGSYLIFLIIFGAIFFTEPYSHGYIKNFIGLQPKRSGFVFADFLTGVIFCLLVFLVGGLVHGLMQNRYMAEIFAISNWKDLVPMLGVQFLLHLACLSVTLFLASWFETTARVLAVNLLWSLVFYRPILDLIQTGVGKLVSLPEDFSLQDYSLEGAMKKLSWGASNQVIHRSIIIGLVYLALGLLISSILLNKKDID